jgi:hypothetical protein
MNDAYEIVAPTRQEAVELAEEFIRTVDPYRQPRIREYWPSKDGKSYHVVVGWHGLD